MIDRYALLLAADGALDGDGAAGLGDDRPDGRLAAVGAAVVRAVDGAIADVTDDLAPLRLALRSGESGRRGLTAAASAGRPCPPGSGALGAGVDDGREQAASSSRPMANARTMLV
jgi:hypothetical protein